MQKLLIFVCLFVCILANTFAAPEGLLKSSSNLRRPRDVTWSRPAGRGQVFGSLGTSGPDLYGTGGYKHPIFDDHKGKLEGQAYGQRVLSPNGHSSSYGGRLDWSRDNSGASLDVNKRIHGDTVLTATGQHIHEFDKNTRLKLEGGISKNLNHGKPEGAAMATFEKHF